jgi:hypothetical protein
VCNIETEFCFARTGQRPDSRTGDSLRELLGAESAARLRNGEVVVAGSRLSHLKWLSASGTLVSTVGQRGRSPNELGGAIHVYLEGDTIVAHDVSYAVLVEHPSIRVVCVLMPFARLPALVVDVCG